VPVCDWPPSLANLFCTRNGVPINHFLVRAFFAVCTPPPLRDLIPSLSVAAGNSVEEEISAQIIYLSSFIIQCLVVVCGREKKGAYF
jgi:hypothetical protein